MGKHKHFKFMGFLKILDEAEIHTIPKTREKWILINTEKVWEKKQTFQSFSNILGKAEIHTIPKIWKKWIPIVRRKYEKTQTFQSSVLLNFFTWCRNLCSSQNMGKVDFHYTEKVWKNTNISNLWVFLNISDEAEIHTIPRTWEKWISIIREKYGKKTNIPK